MCQTACFELQQAGLGITLILVLTDSILVVLTTGVALQFKSEDGNTVQENHQVDPLAFLVVHLFHHRQNVLLIQSLCLRVEGSGRLAVHQMQGDTIIKLHTVLQHIQQAAVLLVDLIIDVIEDRLPGLVLIELLQPGQRLLLGCLQKGEQQFRVHAVAGFKRVGRPNLIAVLIPQHFQDICLIVSLFF